MMFLKQPALQQKGFVKMLNISSLCYVLFRMSAQESISLYKLIYLSTLLNRVSIMCVSIFPVSDAR